ncbi:hypothetical protein [Stieleria mannarensis]|uniref:hypothetical protein n=1 Tax=Stieleria mannarensis TaxID=2755585 RepID=UPI0016028E3D|nr:hypothetical protein [Rhodopirellula sp. JC639]
MHRSKNENAVTHHRSPISAKQVPQVIRRRRIDGRLISGRKIGGIGFQPVDPGIDRLEAYPTRNSTIAFHPIAVDAFAPFPTHPT